MPAPVQVPAQQSSEDYSSDPEIWDLTVVGAGIAGCSVAYSLAKGHSRRILLLERDLQQPDRIVGELLQPGGVLALQRLGLEDCVSGIDAQKVYGYYMFKDGNEARVAYPVDGVRSLPGREVAGRSFHNGCFVQRLRQAAASCPGVTLRQATVRRLINGKGGEWDDGQVVAGVQYRSQDGTVRTASAHLTVVCDGMHSSLRRKLSNPDIHHPSHFVGLLLEDATLPHPNFGHVVLGEPSPILFYPISSTQVRCLVDVPGEKLPQQGDGSLASYLLETVAPQVPQQLREAFGAAVHAGRMRSMQNKQMPAAPLHCPGALLLGDAFNMRHPLTGGGMTVALSDTQLLREMLLPLPDFSDPIQTANATAAFYVRRKPLSATVNTLANALYAVFCWKDSASHEEMRKACFDYLRLGGMHAEGPMSLLSGLRPQPSILVMHFFMVALYGVGRLLVPFPSPSRVYLAFALLWTAASIIFPIIQAEGWRAVFLPALANQPQARHVVKRE
ncbi:hypothetical protein WJX84_003359 [Apatococcus fuscideae]|uniref:Squalene monooxygenase n=1 Tax=Apatococcus fuscideae TaxID=2026836 RepID=A0AAW1T4V0_9CHLO